MFRAKCIPLGQKMPVALGTELRKMHCKEGPKRDETCELNVNPSQP